MTMIMKLRDKNTLRCAVPKVLPKTQFHFPNKVRNNCKIGLARLALSG